MYTKLRMLVNHLKTLKIQCLNFIIKVKILKVKLVFG